MDLIILGMGQSRYDCPYDSEVWGVNNGYRQVMSYNKEREIAPQEIERLTALVPATDDQRFSYFSELQKFTRRLSDPSGRLDKLFICHRGQEFDSDGDPVFDFNELNDIASQGVEIISLFKVKELPKFTRYPYYQVVKKFGTTYFSDTIAYMLAYATHCTTRKHKGLLRLTEPLRIRMYGCDMHTQDEYATERGGIEYFIAVIRTLGGIVWLHPDSSLCKTSTGKPYGFWRFNPKLYDANNILKLQKSVEGLKTLKKANIISESEFNEMKEYLNEHGIS